MSSKRIYIADDDANIRQAIQVFLENEGYLVEAFENGNLLLKRFREQECELIILDVMMPEINGFDLCAEIRKVSTVPVIMLTARDSDIDYATGLSLGSDDYFTKPFSAMALMMRVKAIFRRIEFESKKLDNSCNRIDQLRVGNVLIDCGGKLVFIDGQEIALTPNEYDLLQYMMKHRGQAVSREELLENVWGYQAEVETRATDDTVRRLRKKIEKSNVVIEAVWGFGFRLKEQDSHDE